MNLQHQCSDLVFLEVPESGNTAAQGIGLIHRIGQKSVQNIDIVTCNYSWDQRQQARAAFKMYGQIAGQEEIKIPDDKVLALTREVASGEVDGSDEDSKDDGVIRMRRRPRAGCMLLRRASGLMPW